MPVDTSIYAPMLQRTDPFQRAEQIQSLQNASAQNQLLQNENKLFQARQGAGQLVSQAIDPQTGQFDRTKFNALLARNPDLAPYAMEALQGGNAAATGQSQSGSAAQQLSQEKVKTYQSHLGLFSQVLAPLAASDKPTKADAYKAASQLISNPDLDPETRQQLVGDSVQFLGDLPDDPQVIKQRVKALQLQVQDAGARLAAITGQTGLTNTGSEQVPVTTNSYTGTVTRGNGPPIANTISPSDASSLVEVTNADGSKSYITKGEALQKRQGAPGAPGPEGQVGGAPAGGAPAPQPQTIGSSLSPAAANASATTGAAYAKNAADLADYAGHVPEHKAVLQNLRATLENFQPGPQAHLTKTLGQLAGEYGLAPPSAAEGTAAQEEYSKLAWQIAHAQNAQMGGHGTDAQTNAAMSASPSEFLSKLGNKNVIAVLLGNEDAIAAKNAAWQKYSAAGHGAETFGQFNAELNKHFDPLAFQWPYLSGQQKANLTKALKDSGQWNGFQHKLKFAETMSTLTEAQ